jgi:hypothetical protein
MLFSPILIATALPAPSHAATISPPPTAEECSPYLDALANPSAHITLPDVTPARFMSSPEAQVEFANQCLNLYAPSSTSSTSSTSSSTPACPTFLLMRAWYCDLLQSDNINLKEVVSDGTTTSNQIALTAFIWTVILNIASDLFILVGYLSIAFIIFGGYSYLLSRGNPEEVKKGKKIITSAVIGLIIAILAASIVNTIISVIR